MFQAYKQAYKRPYEVPLAGDPRSIIGGAEGFWLDFTDMSTMFQDSAGTIPVTALGDPVGLVRDKSGNGYDASITTASARPTFGRMPYGGVRNQITHSENFSDAVWGKTRVTYDAVTGSVAETVDSGAHNMAFPAVSTRSGGKKYVSVWVEKGDLASAPDWIQICTTAAGFGTTNSFRVNFNISTMQIGAIGANVSDASITEDSGYIRLRAAITASADSSSAFIVLGLTNNTDGSRLPTYAGNVLANVFVRQASVEDLAYADYQKVVQAYDVTEAGVDSVPCLWFDGVDDYLGMTSRAADLMRNAGRFTSVVAVNPSKSSSPAFFVSTAASPATVRFQNTLGSSTNDAITARRLDGVAAQSLTVAGSTFLNVVRTGVVNYLAASASLSVNGSVVASSDAFLTAGNTSDTASQAVLVGRQDTLYSGGFLVGQAAVKNTLLTANQLASLEGYFMDQMGIAA